MIQLEHLDKLIEEGKNQVEADVSALIGIEFKLVKTDSSVVSKKECFASLVGKQVLAHVDGEGGTSGLFTSVKDAIQLGGKLIMLPDSELEELVNAEDYTEDLADSYGEIAHIVIGAWAKFFANSYPKDCHFVCGEMVELDPAQVNPESDEYIRRSDYYQAVFSIKLGGNSYGNMVFTLPAKSLGLERTVASDVDNGVGIAGEEVGSINVLQEENLAKAEAIVGGVFAKIGNELGVLLGGNVELSELENKLLQREDFVHTIAKQQAVAQLDSEGKPIGLLSLDLEDALYMSGLLIMLPPSDLEQLVAASVFDEDSLDAFSELADIISGLYSTAFNERFPNRPRFERGEMSSSSRQEIEGFELGNGDLFYHSSMGISVGGKVLGRMNFLINADAFDLTSKGAVGDYLNQGTGSNVHAHAGAHDGFITNGSGSHASQNTISPSQYDILLVANDTAAAGRISDIATSQGYEVGCVGFGENVSRHISPRLKVVFLVMTEINEQLYGMAIKLGTTADYTLVAAGPGWTRSSVIKAVKYGVKDILLTPAGDGDIAECIQKHMSF